LYTTDAPAAARRLAERFEWHYTPKHGSWLDLAESELGVLSSRCLDRRIEDKDCLIGEVAAWQQHRTNTTPRRTGSSQTRKRGQNSSGFTRHFD
jgi:hypothetical protein